MFMCGVCEGFYGKPWTATQRKELFVRMKRFGMTTYLYAPKDDYKHRLYWRKLYSTEEAAELRSLITAAKENNVDFVYAISPGLDMVFSDKQDVDCLKSKLEQVQSFGCSNFALLFDDIDADLCPEDEEVYDSVAHAQAALTNMLYHHLSQPTVFLFCPTEYCTSRAEPDLCSSEYLKTIGEMLEKGVDIMWTGSKVVPRRITLESIIEVKEILRRPPVIWENLHANDYDQTRVYLGPYTGRPHELKAHLHGVLTNPNCEFHANFVAMHCLAQWAANTVTQFPEKTAEKGSESTDAMDVEPTTNPPYLPYRALRCAVRDWIPEFYKPWGSGGDQKELREDDKELMESDPDEETGSGSNEEEEEDKMEVNEGNGATAGVSRERRKMEELGDLTEDDLLLLCDLHHLPFEHGPRGINLLKQAAWLIDNVNILEENKYEVEEPKKKKVPTATLR